ncbi:unnamed protein product [Arabidopsis lyrata]|nr:unnamed protein product [Arabidopsis lyrata]
MGDEQMDNIVDKTRAANRDKRLPKLAANLPYDLVEEILLKLPVKSLARFNLTCKEWGSLFSGRRFYLQTIVAEIFEMETNRWRRSDNWECARQPPMIVSVGGNSYWIASSDGKLFVQRSIDSLGTGHNQQILYPVPSFFITEKKIVMFCEELVEEGTAHIKVLIIAQDGIQQIYIETYKHKTPSLNCLYLPSLLPVPMSMRKIGERE